MTHLCSRIDFGDFGYSEEVLKQMVYGMVGKQFYDQERKPIGTIVKADLVEGTKHVELMIGLDEGKSVNISASRRVSLSIEGGDLYESGD